MALVMILVCSSHTAVPRAAGSGEGNCRGFCCHSCRWQPGKGSVRPAMSFTVCCKCYDDWRLRHGAYQSFHQAGLQAPAVTQDCSDAGSVVTFPATAGQAAAFLSQVCIIKTIRMTCAVISSCCRQQLCLARSSSAPPPGLQAPAAPVTTSEKVLSAVPETAS